VAGSTGPVEAGSAAVAGRRSISPSERLMDQRKKSPRAITGKRRRACRTMA
jgi:hypothetical protein